MFSAFPPAITSVRPSRIQFLPEQFRLIVDRHVAQWKTSTAECAPCWLERLISSSPFIDLWAELFLHQKTS